MRRAKIIMDKRKISFILVFLLFFACNLFANEIDVFLGHTNTKKTDSTSLCGVDFYFWEQEYKSKVFKTKKLKLGARISYFSFNQEEIKYIDSNSIKLGMRFEFFGSKNFSFNYKTFLGIGMYTGERKDSNGILQAINKNHWEMDLSAGVTYLLTKRFGLSTDLGYRLSTNFGDKGSMPSFAPFGLIATINIVYLYTC
jgi:hypothetical protein